jgi:cathepsin D
MKDSVSLAGFTVPNQTFASCHSITPDLLSGDVSGILGLGFQSIAASEAMPWWQNLAEQGQISEMGFAFTRYLHTPEAATSVMPGGIATFGAANSSLYTGDISWNSLTDTGYWMIAMQSMSVNGTVVPGISSNRVAIDTGTSLIGAPAEAVTQLFAQIPGSSPSTSDSYRGYYYVSIAFHLISA